MSLDSDEVLKEERKDQNEGEDKRQQGKTPKTSPRFFISYYIYSSTPKPSIKQLSKSSNVTLEKEHKCDTLMTLLGHESRETLKDID